MRANKHLNTTLREMASKKGSFQEKTKTKNNKNNLRESNKC